VVLKRHVVFVIDDACMNMHNSCKFMHTDFHQQDRRSAILRLLRGSTVHGQSDLVRLLKREGHKVTQSSVSRDLRDMRVLKVSGRYLPPGDETAPTNRDFDTLAQFVRAVDTAGPSLTVIRTTVGAAQSVASAIDRSEWPEVVGTISGDDTIFIATRDTRAQSQVRVRLRESFGI
jgi:transcriptional regulator of arginine metabolism